MSKELDDLKNVLEVQGYDGNWDHSEYMWGMYNGLELAVATMENREPKYRDKPARLSTEAVAEAKHKESLITRLHHAWRKK